MEFFILVTGCKGISTCLTKPNGSNKDLKIDSSTYLGKFPKIHKITTLKNRITYVNYSFL